MAEEMLPIRDVMSRDQARSKQCLIGPAIAKLSAGDLGAG